MIRAYKRRANVLKIYIYILYIYQYFIQGYGETMARYCKSDEEVRIFTSPSIEVCIDRKTAVSKKNSGMHSSGLQSYMRDIE